MTKKEFSKILSDHKKWINDNTKGVRANLSRANLSGADLSRANLYGADLYGANLSRANLYGANLSRADLSGANLSRADLSGANLYGAILSGAILYGANLSGANLYGANLSRADLSGADLSGANLSGADLKNTKHLYYSHIPEEGAFVVWKKCRYDAIVKLLIPEDAERTSSIVGRKCRASKVKVLGIWDKDGNEVKDALGLYNSYRYSVGVEVIPDKYDPDPRVECSNGIHFFVTKQEAVEYDQF